MKIIRYAQSTFMFEHSSGERILLDPGKYNFGDNFTPKDFGSVDTLVITHKHADHFDLDVVKEIYGLHSPTIYTNPEISLVLGSNNIPNTSVNVGDTLTDSGFTLTLVKADHVVRGEYVVNFGLVLEADGKRVYHTSDTRLMDLSLLPDKVLKPDVLFVPISNRGVVMGIDDALYFTNDIQPSTVVPIHYDSPKDKPRVKPEHFAERKIQLEVALPNLASSELKIMQFGEELNV